MNNNILLLTKKKTLTLLNKVIKDLMICKKKAYQCITHYLCMRLRLQPVH